MQSELNPPMVSPGIYCREGIDYWVYGVEYDATNGAAEDSWRVLCSDKHVRLDETAIYYSQRYEEFAGGLAILGSDARACLGLEPPTIEPGLYRHQKGGIYRVNGIELGVTAGAPESWRVRYGNAPIRYIGNMIVNYSRECAEFTEQVLDLDHPGQTVPRFSKITEPDHA